MEHDENVILKGLLFAWKQDQAMFFDQISELTGIHVILVRSEGSLYLVQDCSGLKPAYYGHVGTAFYITSHPQLVADIVPVTLDESNDRLIATKTYNIGNRYLPGDSTRFDELRRLGPNTYLRLRDSVFSVQRFYPTEELHPVAGDASIDDTVTEISNLLNGSLRLVTEKWKRPAIPLTGGTDSKTTLASAHGLYDKFSYFSFHSKPSEVVDAEGAGKICQALALNHVVYPVPDENQNIEDFDALKAVVNHNTSYFKNMADNEIRKMIVLERLDDFDVEVKSWVSETVRVFMDRKYGIRMPARLRPRHFSIFQTRYLGSPRLLAEADRRNRAFLQKTAFTGPPSGWEESDLYYWEVRMGAWGTSVISALDYAHRVTIPFNNRKLVTRFLQLPRELRKSDEAHRRIMEVGDPRVPEQGVEIRNPGFHDYRIWLEKGYFLYRTLPGTFASRLKGLRTKH